MSRKLNINGQNCILGHTDTRESQYVLAMPRSSVGSASDSRVRGLGFDTQSGHILSFLLPLIQEG